VQLFLLTELGDLLAYPTWGMEAPVLSFAILPRDMAGDVGVVGGVNE